MLRSAQWRPKPIRLSPHASFSPDAVPAVSLSTEVTPVIARVGPLRSVCVLLCCLFLHATLASAQSVITGLVKDQSGAVLPGVTVEATSTALIEGSRTAATDGNGQYRLVD